MAQAIVCYNHEGLVLATDSLVLQEMPGGQVVRLTEHKLFTLGRHAVLLTDGAAVGVDLGRKLAAWVEARRLVDTADVLAVSRDFISEGYARFLRLHPDPEGLPRHLYFILGGCSEACAPHPQGWLLHSEAGQLPFEETELGRVFTLPRRLALEGRVTRQIAEGASLQQLVELCQTGLQSVAERNPESVAGPYEVAIVTEEGVRLLDEPE